MNQSKAYKLAEEAFTFFEKKEYVAAEKKYIDAVALADPNHSFTTTIHGEFACVLQNLDKSEGALEQLKLSLQTAKNCNPLNSSAVSVAQYFLGQFYVNHNKPDKALEVIAPSLELKGETKWIIYYIATYAYYLLGDTKQVEYFAAKTVEIAPADKYESVAALKEYIENDRLSNQKRS